MLANRIISTKVNKKSKEFTTTQHVFLGHWFLYWNNLKKIKYKVNQTKQRNDKKLDKGDGGQKFSFRLLFNISNATLANVISDDQYRMLNICENQNFIWSRKRKAKVTNKCCNEFIISFSFRLKHCLNVSVLVCLCFLFGYICFSVPTTTVLVQLIGDNHFFRVLLFLFLFPPKETWLYFHQHHWLKVYFFSVLLCCFVYAIKIKFVQQFLFNVDLTAKESRLLRRKQNNENFWQNFFFFISCKLSVATKQWLCWCLAFVPISCILWRISFKLEHNKFYKSMKKKKKYKIFWIDFYSVDFCHSFSFCTFFNWFYFVYNLREPTNVSNELLFEASADAFVFKFTVHLLILPVTKAIIDLDTLMNSMEFFEFKLIMLNPLFSL